MKTTLLRLIATPLAMEGTGRIWSGRRIVECLIPDSFTWIRPGCDLAFPACHAKCRSLGGLLSLASPEFLRQIVAASAVGASRAEVGWAIFGWGLVLAIAAGVVGSLYPAAVALRLRPAEMLRSE